MSSYKEKKQKLLAEQEEAKKIKSVIIQFKTGEGETKGPQIDIPSDTTPQQLEELLNQLIESEEPVPFAFYIDSSEVSETVGAILKEQNKSTESVVSIEYRPLSIYRVVPLTRCTDSIPGHTEAILHISFSPSGDVLGTGGGDMTVRFWDAQTCTPIQTCKGHKNHVLCTSWSPSGKYFASGDKDGKICVWNGTTGELVCELSGHRQWITSLCWEPLHLSKNCERLASSSKDGTVIIWNVRTHLKDHVISGHSDSIECVRWSGSGLVITASRDRTIRVWSLEGMGGKLVRSLLGHAHRINSLTLNTDYVMRCGGYDWDHRSFTDSQTMFECSLQKYNTFIQSNKELLCSCSDDFTLFLWEPAVSSRPIARLIGHQQLVNHVMFSPDGRYLASASFDKKVKVWDPKTGKLLNTLHGHVGSVYQLTWSPDSRFIASASKDSTVKVWKPLSKNAQFTLSGHADEVYAVDWSPFGTQAASGGKDRLVKIWSH